MTCWQVRNGFLSVRVWFPAVAGVLTSGDQEVIIMCKPPAPAPPPPASSNTLGEEEGSVRVAGQLDTPSRRLSYEVALYSQLEDGEEEGSSVSGAVEIGADMIMSIMCSTCFLDICYTYITCLTVQAPCSSSGSRWLVWAGRRGRGGAWRCWTWSSHPGIYIIHIYNIYNIYNIYICNPPQPLRAPRPGPRGAGGWRLPRARVLALGAAAAPRRAAAPARGRDRGRAEAAAGGRHAGRGQVTIDQSEHGIGSRDPVTSCYWPGPGRAACGYT